MLARHGYHISYMCRPGIEGSFASGWHLHQSLSDRAGKNMFVPADDDSYDPGIPIGTRFPPIRARHEGRVLRSIDPFIHDRGAIFIAVRSVDW